jgi:hypothetical protein
MALARVNAVALGGAPEMARIPRNQETYVWRSKGS